MCAFQSSFIFVFGVCVIGYSYVNVCVHDYMLMCECMCVQACAHVCLMCDCKMPSFNTLECYKARSLDYFIKQKFCQCCSLITVSVLTAGIAYIFSLLHLHASISIPLLLCLAMYLLSTSRRCIFSCLTLWWHAASDFSLQWTCSERCHPPPILAEQSLILRKMSPHWRQHGLTCRWASKNSFFSILQKNCSQLIKVIVVIPSSLCLVS